MNNLPKTQINQLTLGVSLKDTATFENYFTGAFNTHLVKELSRAVTSLERRVIYLYGGYGRTHLLQACCHAATAAGHAAIYLPLSELKEFSPLVLEGFETLNVVCIDDIQYIANQSNWEEAFFHAFNRMQESGTTLIMTANATPQLVGLQLPDLISRLAWGIIFHVAPLSDSEKLAMLVMRAQRRGMTLSEEVARFILTHCPRHISTLSAALDVLDRTSLAAQRKLTIPFVKTVLEI